jgi:hypothetical protein
MSRHLASMIALAGFAILALGSGDGDVSAADPDGPGAMAEAPTAQDAARAQVEQARNAAAARVQAEQARPAPFMTTEGQCCCSLMESDRAVHRFMDAPLCTDQRGTCTVNPAACQATEAAAAEAAGSCCCEATGRIVDGGSGCEGTCHEHYVEGDTPGSCEW